MSGYFTNIPVKNAGNLDVNVAKLSARKTQTN